MYYGNDVKRSKRNSCCSASIGGSGTPPAVAARRTRGGVGVVWGFVGTLVGITIIGVLLLLFHGERTNVFPTCATWSCKHFSQLLTLSLDDTRDPCQNFYLYVCNKWQERFPQYPSVLMALRHDAIIRVGQSALAKRVQPTGQNNIEKAVRFYQSCVRAKQREDDEIITGRSLLRLMRLPWPRVDVTADPLLVLLDLYSKWSLALWFSVEVGSGAFPPVVFNSYSLINNWPWVTWIDPISQMQNGRDIVRILFHLFNSDINFALTDTFLNQLQSTDNIVIPTLRSAAARHEDDVSFENVVDFSYGIEVPNMTEHTWVDYLRRTLSSNVQVNSPVKVKQLSLLRACASLLHDIEKNHLLLHMGWLVAVTIGELIIQNITQIMNHGTNHALHEETSYTKCFFLTEDLWTFAWSVPILSSYLNRQKLRETEEILRAVIRAIVHRIEHAKWLDIPSKQGALSQLDGLRIYWGEPQNEQWVHVYDDIPDMGDSLLENWANLSQVLGSVRQTMSQRNYTYMPILRQPEWQQSQRRLALTAARLIPPLFYENSTLGIGIAPLGAKISSMLMSAFVVVARLAFATASPAATTEQAARLQCFINELQSEGVSATPSKLADVLRVGPLADAYWLMNRTDEDERRGRLEGHEWLTDFQMMFISVCYTTCGRAGDIEQEAQCNVALRNWPGFAQAFQCPAGSPMNPINRCTFF
ncbi:membrane metallo-endopeptidase-like 1 isoform X2 [Ornithodoros turicata]|uniref:membrane metallo-endopeptidase-like 1 isoform X2 n=1 Tax=Ornithodoros turicata TaxID=34597 RepID=UPI00313967C0